MHFIEDVNDIVNVINEPHPAQKHHLNAVTEAPNRNHSKSINPDLIGSNNENN